MPGLGHWTKRVRVIRKLEQKISYLFAPVTRTYVFCDDGDALLVPMLEEHTVSTGQVLLRFHFKLGPDSVGMDKHTTLTTLRSINY